MGFAVNVALGSTLVVYSLLQAMYNLQLKRVMFVDVVAIAIGFALRATAGAAAIEVQLSIWLLLCVFFLCLYLGFVKRLCDIASARAADGSKWESPAGYGDMIELNWLLGVSAVLALMMYLMYSLSQHALSLFGSRALGFALLSPLVMIVMHRFYRRAYRGTSDSPLSALREDRAVLVAVILFSVGTLAILFAPQVQNVLDLLYVAGASDGIHGQP
jgi:4-hydroxybenzoate polyprenyltransferase